MATEIQPEKPLEVMMTNLKVDPSSGVNCSTKIAAKSGGSSDVAFCISASGDATSLVKGSDVDQESLNATEQSMYYYPPGGYYGYHYPGFDGSFAGEWDEGGYFLGSEGLEGQYSAVQGENGSVIYYMPGFQFGYNPYGSYAPGTMISTDGQYFGQQQLVPSAVYPQPLAYQGYYTSPISYGSEVFSTYPLEASPTYGEGAHGNGFGVVPTVVSATKPNFSSTHIPTKVTPQSKFSNPSEKDSSPLLDFPPSNPSMKPANKNGSNFPAAAVLAKGYFPIPKFHGKSGELLSSNGSLNSAKANGQGWVGEEKLKPRGKAGGISDVNLLNEQNRGPRTHGAKNTLVSCIDPVGSENIGKTNNSSLVIKRDLYNLPDFPGRYEHALFYVIKSYSEDDIHKSIKYSVWASTPNGNKRLDGAYQDAQQKMEESGAKCPVFLFFSVNASGQFCGVAEMMGRVDFNKNMDFWQQDKWNGFFPVKWHIIKDVPNPQFRHILLVNNENKPVTNSRDTQEVKFHHGIEMLDIFKNYSAKTCILDDFEFYENRQKVMQDKRSRPVTPCLEHMQFAEKKHDGYIQLARSGEMKYDVGCRPSPEFTYVKRNKEELEAGRKLKD